jgi:hypothetical protein
VNMCITKQLKIAHKKTWAGLANARLLLRRYTSKRPFYAIEPKRILITLSPQYFSEMDKRN